MKKIKFLHCADLHLDVPFSSVGQEGGRSAVRRQDLKNVFDNIIRTAGEQKVDLLLICGDLYEHSYVRKSTIHFISDGFRRIPDTAVVLLPGNHDPYTAGSYYRNFMWPENVHILSRGNPYLFLREKGACIYGAVSDNFDEDRRRIREQMRGRALEPEQEQARSQTPERGQVQMQTQARAQENDPGLVQVQVRQQAQVLGAGDAGLGTIHILLAHGTVDMPFNDSGYYPMSSRELDGLGMDYIALGHFHNHMEAVGEGRVAYNPGSPEPLGFDEPGDHGFFLGEIIKAEGGLSRIDVSFVKAGSKFYRDITLDVSGCCTDEQVAERIRNALGIEASKDALGMEASKNGIYRFTLRGYTGQGFSIDLQQVALQLEGLAFLIRLKDETALDADFDEMVKEPGLRGLFVGKMLSLMRSTEDEDRRRLLEKALHYGLEALERGNVDVTIGVDEGYGDRKT